MDADGRAALGRQLHARCDLLAAQWRRAIARTGFAPADPATVELALTRLAGNAAEILVAGGFVPERAQDLGAAVVALGYAAPEALRGTLQTLGRELVADLPAADLAALQPRLLALLRELAVGFCAAQQEAILAAQEAERQGQLAARHQIEAQLRAVVGGLPIALFALDRGGAITMADGRGLTALGLTPATAVGRAARDLFAAVPPLVEDVGRALAGEETTVVTTLGAVVIEARHIPLRDAGGALVGAVGVVLDITARARAEEQLQAVIGHAPIVLFILDRQGTITLATGRGLDALHRRPGETTVGRSIFAAYRDTPAVLDHARRALEGEAFTARTAIADAIYETHYRPLYDDAGMVTGALGVATDITARARAEAALRRHEARLSATEGALLPLLAREDLPTYRQVGAPLGLSPERVRDLVKSLAAKLDVASERWAVGAAARDRGLL